jgi:hypothetical protein
MCGTARYYSPEDHDLYVNMKTNGFMMFHKIKLFFKVTCGKSHIMSVRCWMMSFKMLCVCVCVCVCARACILCELLLYLQPKEEPALTAVVILWPVHKILDHITYNHPAYIYISLISTSKIYYFLLLYRQYELYPTFQTFPQSIFRVNVEWLFITDVYANLSNLCLFLLVYYVMGDWGDLWNVGF